MEPTVNQVETENRAAALVLIKRAGLAGADGMHFTALDDDGAAWSVELRKQS
jgi:hypothetical protein